MELANQLKKYRKALGISQDELAARIFVSRQSISNWETSKTYPDIHTLLLLAEVFGVSVDELIKGDVEKMKETISTQEREGFRRDSFWFTVMFAVVILSIAPLVAFLDTAGICIWALIVGVACYFCGRVELYKKLFDIQTYKEIVAFDQGVSADDLAVIRAERPSTKRSYANSAAYAVVAALIGGTCTYGLIRLFQALGLF